MTMNEITRNSRGADARTYPLTDSLIAKLDQPAFPKSAAYDVSWLLDNEMGPNVLWMTEWACEALDLQPGMRVLDLGCGKALSSVFLATEYDVSVRATDLWIPAADNFKRINALGMADQIMPIHAEAHDLPFADGYFDIIISIDAYHYLQICIVVPSVKNELPDGPPNSLRPYWEWDFCSFHSPEWWRKHWQKTGLVNVESAKSLPEGWAIWADWSEVCNKTGAGLEGGIPAGRDAEMLRVDAGETLGLSRIMATKPDSAD